MHQPLLARNLSNSCSPVLPDYTYILVKFPCNRINIRFANVWKAILFTKKSWHHAYQFLILPGILLSMSIVIFTSLTI